MPTSVGFILFALPVIGLRFGQLRLRVAPAIWKGALPMTKERPLALTNWIIFDIELGNAARNLWRYAADLFRAIYHRASTQTAYSNLLTTTRGQRTKDDGDNESRKYFIGFMTYLPRDQ